MQPRMTSAEIDVLVRETARAQHVVEYGVGGSTLIAVEAGCVRVCSAETDKAWIEKAAEHPQLKAAISDGRLAIEHADIGKVVRWGMPLDRTLRKEWLTYPTTPWKVAEADKVDIVFVDGRFRVASALTSALLGRPDLRILVHDMTKRPRRYRPIYSFMDELEQVDSLSVFVRKPGVTDAELLGQSCRSLSSFF